jgi:hypothetical protein
VDGVQNEVIHSRTKAPMNTPHVVAEPNILYLGTPVALVSTVNQDGTHNLAPTYTNSGHGLLRCLGLLLE